MCCGCVCGNGLSRAGGVKVVFDDEFIVAGEALSDPETCLSPALVSGEISMSRPVHNPFPSVRGLGLPDDELSPCG